MCIGIGIVVVVPEDGSPIKIYGKNGNSSHDTILHEMVPVELHNRVAKIEYTYPHALRLDAPDEECRKAAIDLGVAEMGPFELRLKPSIVEIVAKWIGENRIDFDAKTMHRADLTGACLWRANLTGADLRGADLWGADLTEANLSDAYMLGVIGLEAS